MAFAPLSLGTIPETPDCRPFGFRIAQASESPGRRVTSDRRSSASATRSATTTATAHVAEAGAAGLPLATTRDSAVRCPVTRFRVGAGARITAETPRFISPTSVAI